MSLLAGAFEAFRDDPSRPAVIDDERTWSWREFLAEVERIAADLEGGPGGGPVNILLPSGTRFLSTFLAAATLGRPACTLHADWAEPELEAAIADVGRFEPESPGSDDPVFYIGFTSGTSGRPKPFLRRQRSWSSSFAPAGELFSVEAGDLVFLPGSLQHSHFLFGAVFALNRGAGARLFDRFDATLLARELGQTSRGVLYLVPTMLLGLDELGRSFPGVHSVVVSGAKMEPHHWEIARRLFPEATVGELYGASELSFVSVNTEGERPADPGYVGRLFPGVELEIRPPGVVFVRSPYLFEGYLEGSEIDTPVGEDGFMTVGDMGALTEDGLSLSGRASNLLITGGKNVHPEEVEAQLADHPAVKECVVIGVPHPHWGEELVAFLVPAEDGRPEPDSLRAHLKERVASYKVPKRWFLVEEIPRTRAQKTDRSPDGLFERAVEL
ncbi:MAG: AMP-binding protein [Solirubrobacterales bacterium]|nr:AMP-binding protein [Solirubrobacterales bacterium]